MLRILMVELADIVAGDSMAGGFRDMNFTGRTSYINLSFEYKHRDPRIPNMVKEQYFGVSLSVNINDLWFVKSKFR